ncbi:hypothetical protein [Amycolatopsis sp. RTGN1]|uniref:hypothetical protein n=1 Tax=Amycolatopsis ponsaeliensis TaxID=2992142 RepID=UPI00254A7396|nr:hypothetical protein [Amycolatopsis sp. RTGN1]
MGRLVGTGSRLDVLRPFLRDDVELQTEVEQEIFGRGRAEGTICMEVADGIVILDGAPATQQCRPRLLENPARAWRGGRQQPSPVSGGEPDDH